MSDESKYEAYRIAGELYGRLRELLGFGELAMIVDGNVHYQWEYKTSAGRFRSNSFCIGLHELKSVRYIEHVAMKVARDWKPSMRTEQSATSGGVE